MQSYLHDVPHHPGVYLFYSSSDTSHPPLYIGKSIDIQKRLRSHFYQAKQDPKEAKLVQQTHHIEWRLTAGEIGALLLESRLIKHYLPIYNRRLRRTKSICSFQLLDHNGQLQPAVVKQSPSMLTPNQEHYGLFRSQFQAKKWLESLVIEHKLCKKVMGLEKTNRSCFAYQLKKCAGACVNQESIEQHNARLLNALRVQQQYQWPFTGPIGIIETWPNGQEQTIHLIKNWLYLGTTQYDKNTFQFDQQIKNVEFDIDTYKILVPVILNAHSDDNIIEL